MKTMEECVVCAMDGKQTEIFPFLPYILQDFELIGSSPEQMITLLEKHQVNHSQLNILDLGCGKGIVSIELAKQFQCHCLGIDGIRAFIDHANHKAKALGVEALCTFKAGDIREQINALNQFDVIILGAIGSVFGDYSQTLTTLSPHLNKDGIIIIDDGYLDVENNTDYPDLLTKDKMLEQIHLAKMILADEIMAKEDIAEDYDEEADWVEKRCYELIDQYPEKADLFQNYINIQKKEYTALKTEIICSTMLLKRI